MSQLQLVYLVSLILFWTTPVDLSFSPKRSFQGQFIHKYLDSLQNPEIKKVALAYLIGKKRGIRRDWKEAHAILRMQHLFTPSGLHLSSCLALVLPFFLFFRKKYRQQIRHWFINTLCLAIYFLPGFYSLKRISLMRVIYQYIGVLSNQKLWLSFWIAFTLDFTLGSYRQSPSSFNYSFLYLGTLLASAQSPKLFLPLYMLFASWISSYFSGEPLTFLGFILNPILTSLFSMGFPFFLLSLLLMPALSSWFLQNYLSLLSHAAWLAGKSGYYQASLPLIILIFIYKHQHRNIFFSLCLLIHSNSLNQLKPIKSLPLEKRHIALPVASQWIKTQYSKRGLRLYFQSKITCFKRMDTDIQWIHCRQKKINKPKAL